MMGCIYSEWGTLKFCNTDVSHSGRNFLKCLKISWKSVLSYSFARAQFPKIKEFLGKFPEIRKFPENLHPCCYAVQQRSLSQNAPFVQKTFMITSTNTLSSYLFLLALLWVYIISQSPCQINNFLDFSIMSYMPSLHMVPETSTILKQNALKKRINLPFIMRSQCLTV